MDRNAYAEFMAIQESERRHSHAILADHLNDLPSLLRKGKLLAAVDCGFARSLLASRTIVSQAESCGVTLKRQHAVMIAVEILQIISAIVSIVLAFVIFSWWGTLVLVFLPAYIVTSWQTTQLPSFHGWIPKLGALIFAALAVYFSIREVPLAVSLFWIALMLVSVFALLRYAYPVRVVRLALIEKAQLAGLLVDSGAVALYRDEELPHVLRKDN